VLDGKYISAGIVCSRLTRLMLLKFTRSEASDVQRCGGCNLNTGPPSVKTNQVLPSTLHWASKKSFTPLSNDHVMIPQCSILWPIEDVGTNGYCYGWVLNPRLVCAAGVLQVGLLRQSVLPHPRCPIDPEICHIQNTQKPS
jgi:hypothetical protein